MQNVEFFIIGMFNIFLFNNSYSFTIFPSCVLASSRMVPIFFLFPFKVGHELRKKRSFFPFFLLDNFVHAHTSLRTDFDLLTDHHKKSFSEEKQLSLGKLNVELPLKEFN